MNLTKKLLLFLILVIITGISNAQTTEVEGIWKLSEIHDGDQTYPINTTINFKENGNIKISGADAGTWSLNARDNTLIITSDYLMSLSDTNNLKIVTNKKLVIVNTKGDINTLTRMSLPKNAELNNKATGEWLLEKIEKNATTNIIGQIVNFNKNGIFYVQDRILGTWDYNELNKTLRLEAKKISGDHTILKNNKKELVIEKEGEKLFFTKIDKQKIQKENEASALMGVWQFEDKANSNLKIFIIFKAPDNFTVLEKGDGMESNSSGMWIFNEKDKTLVLIGQIEKLRGLNKVISITDKEFSVENKDNLFTLKKVIQDATKIERLTFTEEDFYDENGDYKYNDDEQKLPWQDFYQMIEKLTEVKHLVYKYSTLVESTESFEIITLTADILVNEEEQSLSIDNIFNGFDRYNTPDDYELPTNNYDSYNKLFPLKGDTFRIVRTEEISTPAGTFTCTVIEATASFDERVKLWMINDKPGIIAKVVKDKAGSFGYYKVYELQTIK